MLFERRTGPEQSVEMLSFDTGQPSILLDEGRRGHYLPTDGTLFTHGDGETSFKASTA